MVLAHCIGIIIDLPVVTVTPFIQAVEVTHNAILLATVTGMGVKKFSYQWRHNGRIIKDETSNTLIINNVTEHDHGSYICIINNEYIARVPSNKAQLLVKSMYIYIVCDAT